MKAWDLLLGDSYNPARPWELNRQFLNIRRSPGSRHVFDGSLLELAQHGSRRPMLPILFERDLACCWLSQATTSEALLAGLRSGALASPSDLEWWTPTPASDFHGAGRCACRMPPAAGERRAIQALRQTDYHAGR